MHAIALWFHRLPLGLASRMQVMVHMVIHCRSGYAVARRAASLPATLGTWNVSNLREVGHMERAQATRSSAKVAMALGYQYPCSH